MIATARQFITAFVVSLITLTLSGCATTSSTSGTQTDGQWVGGWLNGGSAVITVNQLGPNKYLLEIEGPASVGVDKLFPVFQARAQKICQSKTPVYQYKIGTWTYDSTVTAVLSMPVTAPTITGIVTCK